MITEKTLERFSGYKVMKAYELVNRIVNPLEKMNYYYESQRIKDETRIFHTEENPFEIKIEFTLQGERGFTPKDEKFECYAQDNLSIWCIDLTLPRGVDVAH